MTSVASAAPAARVKAQSLTIAECARWLAQPESAKAAVRRNLPDLTRWFLATGVRIGEASAVGWDTIDMDHALVAIDDEILRVKGAGLLRVRRAKSDAGGTISVCGSPADARRRRWTRPSATRWRESHAKVYVSILTSDLSQAPDLGCCSSDWTRTSNPLRVKIKSCGELRTVACTAGDLGDGLAGLVVASGRWWAFAMDRGR